jgi:hypothetical protein
LRSMSVQEGPQEVEFLVRCALQSFEDLKVNCPLEWTVAQLKQHLQQICPSKPEATRQRLIYAGHCLENNQTLRSILCKTQATQGTTDGQQVIHLVCAQKGNLPKSDGIRFRQNAASAQSQNNPSSSSNFNHQPVGTTLNGPYGYYPYANAHYLGQLPQNPYESYMAYQYQNYINQMTQYAMMQQHQAQAQGVTGMSPFPFVPMAQQGHQYMAQNIPNVEMHQNVVREAAANNGIAAAAAANDEQAGGNDLLDLVYKSIRVILLLLVIYLYSSFERFISVLLFICVMWFVQMRRDRGNARAAEGGGNNIPPQVDDQNLRDDIANNNFNDNNNNQIMPDQLRAGLPTDHEQGAWSVFWSTVSSFFTSLVPENPVPVNVN